MKVVTVLCALSVYSANSVSVKREKRQYESEIVAISPTGKWTSVYHQPLEAAFPQTGDQPASLQQLAVAQQPHLLNSFFAPSVSQFGTYGSPRYLVIVPPGSSAPNKN